MAKPKIAFLCGSLRKESFHRRLGQAIMSAAADRLDFVTVEIGDLPLYNQDLDTKEPPAEWTRFREQMKTIDGVLFGCPEYNRGITGRSRTQSMSAPGLMAAASTPRNPRPLFPAHRE